MDGKSPGTNMPRAASLEQGNFQCKYWKTTAQVEIQIVSIWYSAVWRDSTNLRNVWHVWAFFNLRDIFADLWGLKADHPPQYLRQYVQIIIVGFPHLFQYVYIYMSKHWKMLGFRLKNTLISLLALPNLEPHILVGARFGYTVYFVVTLNLLHLLVKWLCQRMSEPETNKHPTQRKKVNIHKTPEWIGKNAQTDSRS